MSYRRIVVGCVLALCMVGCAPRLPQRPPITQWAYVDQGWSPTAWQWYHHVSQGTATFLVPYTWLVALEQPRLSLWASPLLVDEGYLRRFGFVPSPRGEHNPDGLPVGFARDSEFVDPETGEGFDAVGFTCAACHTAEIEYQGTAMRIDGGPAMVDLGKFRTTLGLSVAYTKYLPFRFGRFADRVLGTDHSRQAEAELKQQLNAFIKAGKRLKKIEGPIDAASVEEGFGRLDAINRIGNFVFGTEIDPDNLVPGAAPVNFPHLWDASWFSWVQYNASIRQPMVRNAGEALGVRAFANFRRPGADLFRSTVQVRNLYEIEELLAGPAPFRGLRPPAWPEEILGKIDQTQAARGAALYRELCQGCHLPPVGSPELHDPHYWEPPNDAGESYLRLKLIDVDDVGTDPGQAAGMKNRRVKTGALGWGEMGFGPALGRVTQEATEYWYDHQEPPVPPAERRRMNGNRENRLQTEMHYKARPLDGIWATAPYLHNGSVPNLYSLLVPAEDRPQRFYLGSHQFDPTHVGYDYAPLGGGFELDTSIAGNSNQGHEFRDGPRGNGVVGRLLSEEERWALVEYLKTL